MNTALEEGTFAVAGTTTQMALAAPEGPIPVEITNTQDIYDPARIDALRDEGLNNREIGIALREGTMEGTFAVAGTSNTNGTRSTRRPDPR